MKIQLPCRVLHCQPSAQPSRPCQRGAKAGQDHNYDPADHYCVVAHLALLHAAVRFDSICLYMRSLLKSISCLRSPKLTDARTPLDVTATWQMR